MGRTPRPPPSLKYDNMGASGSSRRCRIGVGAWRTCQGTHTARRHWPASLTSLSLRCHPSTLRRKETGPLAESVVNSHPWRVQTWHAGGYRPPAPPESSAVPLARHPEAFRRKVKKRYARPNAQSKNLTEQSSPRLTTLIGVQRLVGPSP